MRIFDIETNMLEPHWDQNRPSYDDVQRVWHELEISCDPLTNPAVDYLLAELRHAHVNGGAEFCRFAIEPHPVLHWFGSRNRLEEIDFFNKFLSAPRVVAGIPAVNIDASSVSIKMTGGVGPFTLDGEIAALLVQGGAYQKVSGTSREAKNLAAKFCHAVFGDRFTEVLLFSSGDAWTKWFYDVAWDYTWLGFDKRDWKVWFLCVTDTD